MFLFCPLLKCFCLGFRVVLQQNEKFSEIEEKYNSLQGKTSSLFDMEEEVLKVSKKVRLSCSGTGQHLGMKV